MITAMPQPRHSAGYGSALKLRRKRIFGEVSIAPLKPELPENPPAIGRGTALAINSSILGYAAHLPCSTRRGGARNRADRESHGLAEAQIANLTDAERHAERIGLPFTRMMTIHWGAAGVPLAEMAKATGQFVDLFAKALARHKSRTAWLWVHEGGDRKGGHCHLLVHVPSHLVRVVMKLQKGWLRRITGKPYVARVIHSKPIGGRLGLEKSNPALHATNLQAAFAYLCKGAPQSILDRFGIDRRHEPGGLVIGKRCGTSQNIGAKARKAAD